MPYKVRKRLNPGAVSSNDLTRNGPKAAKNSSKSWLGLLFCRSCKSSLVLAGTDVHLMSRLVTAVLVTADNERFTAG